MKPRLAAPSFLNRPRKPSDCRGVIADDPHIDMVAMPSLEMMLTKLGVEIAVVGINPDEHNIRRIICGFSNVKFHSMYKHMTHN